ncbi:MAG: class II fructose-bisphosphatase [Actinomycetota bacterium]|nr:class II fructose-bisphosphatase [Actinomycetota bacterium]
MATVSASPLPTRPALEAAQAAALACRHWIGRGDDKAADAAATEAMRTRLARAPGRGTVIIGEGEKDEAPMLHNGEQLGDGDGPDFDIAVDPLECTDLCAAGLPGALATIAMASSGSMWSPGPALYMDKLVVGPAAREAIDLRATPEENLSNVAQALGRPVEEMTVVVLDKSRHESLIARLRSAGAAVSTPSAGDVAGALAALLADGEADMLMGVGGTPEGVMTACAVAALGGGMQGRPAPQDEAEGQAVAEAGIDTERVLGVEELVNGPALFVATGVSGGPLLRRPWYDNGVLLTESIVIASDRVQRIVEGAPQDE